MADCCTPTTLRVCVLVYACNMYTIGLPTVGKCLNGRFMQPHLKFISSSQNSKAVYNFICKISNCTFSFLFTTSNLLHLYLHTHAYTFIYILLKEYFICLFNAQLTCAAFYLKFKSTRKCLLTKSSTAVIVVLLLLANRHLGEPVSVRVERVNG